MKREIIKDLLKWKESSNRKPLIVLGARQVGKTYIIKKLNGATVSTEEITSDYYHALDKIIKKGMKR